MGVDGVLVLGVTVAVCVIVALLFWRASGKDRAEHLRRHDDHLKQVLRSELDALSRTRALEGWSDDEYQSRRESLIRSHLRPQRPPKALRFVRRGGTVD